MGVNMDKKDLYRGKCIHNNKWVYGDLIRTDDNSRAYIGKLSVAHDDYPDSLVVDIVEVDPKTVGRYAELRDRNGNKIYESDVLKFEDHNGIWQSSVVFERGVFGLDVCKVKQIQNPKDWKEKHDKVKSRGWAYEWGYEEFGTAFAYRQPLSQKSIFRGNHDDYKNSELYTLYEKYGHGNYYVLAEIIGNIHDNPELVA